LCCDLSYLQKDISFKANGTSQFVHHKLYSPFYFLLFTFHYIKLLSTIWKQVLPYFRYNSLVNNKITYTKYLIVACISISCMVLHKSYWPKETITTSVFKINTQLRSAEKEAKEELEKTTVWENIIKTGKTDKAHRLGSPDFNILLFKQDSLCYWLKTPDFSLPKTIYHSSDANFIYIEDNVFEVWADTSISGYLREIWVPVKIEHLVTKNPLDSIFIGTPNSLIIHSKDKNVIYLNQAIEVKNVCDDLVRLILYLSGFLCLLLAINQITIRFLYKYQGWISSAFLLVNIFGLRFLSNYLNVSYYFNDIPLFTQSIHSSYLGVSIGDFLLNAIVFLWVVIFWYKTYRQAHYDHLGIKARGFIGTFNYFAILLGIIMITGIIKSIILESDIYFDFENVFNLGSNSLYSIIGLMIVFITLFLFSQRLMFTINQLKLSKLHRIFSILGSLVIAYIFLVEIPVITINIRFFLFGLLYLLLLDFYTDSESTDFTWLLIWLIIFSSFSAALLYTFNQNKEEKRIQQYAITLSNPRDSILERIYQLKAGKPSTDRDSIRKSLKAFLENNYTKAYYTLVQDSGRTNPIKTWNETDQTNLKWGIEPINGDIHYKIIESKDSALFEIATNSIKDIRDFQYIAYNIEPYKGLKHLDQFSYSIFYRGHLVYHNQNANYSISLNNDRSNTKTYSQNLGGLNYDAKHKSGREIHLEKQGGGFIKILNLFSYLFVLLALTILIFIALNTVVRIIPGIFYIEKSSDLTLRNRIQISIISMIILSFLAIGTITIFYFRYSNKKADLEAQLKKLNIITELSTQKDGKVNIEMTNFERIAVELQTELLIYKPNGFLFKSIPASLVNLNPAFQLLPKSPEFDSNTSSNSKRVIQINGNDKFGMIGTEINPDKENHSWFISIPSYGSEPETKSQLADFIGALINTYVFLLLIASALALAVGRSITSPLLALGEKLKRLKFGKHNEPLKWDNSDEIGTLVQEYNQMILKLDDSANILAQSEREKAWREMAQQVAHEIKNPLTPMKLNIQYLLHSFHSDPENLEKRIKNISNVLIQQIENLSQIAGEFNNFAKEPQLNNEQLEVNEIIKGVVALFEKASSLHVKITKDITTTPINVIGDKSHLIRIFNNLINNAQQALVDERPGRIHIQLQQKNGYAIISVSDNGMGISKEKEDKIFLPNFTTKSRGSGLGLPICKKLIESMDGEIFFESGLNQGTTFYVTIPIYIDFNKD